MSYFKHYELRQLENRQDEFELIIFLDELSTEVSNELGIENADNESKGGFIDSAKKLIANKYPGMKVTMVRVMISGMILSSIPITATVAAAQTPTEPGSSVQSNQSSTHYRVQSGDTLWNIAKKFNITVDQLKQANQLPSDTVQINQQLIIPSSFHTVAQGESLFTIARANEVSTNQLIEANQLTTDRIVPGQLLVIPIILQNETTNIPTITPTIPGINNSISYKVVQGDSLFSISRQFGVSVDTIKLANKLTSDTIRVGQDLVIPRNVNSNETTIISSPTNTTTPTSSNSNAIVHTVQSGDTLFQIANRYKTTVIAIKQLNNLSSDIVTIGQLLQIPNLNQQQSNPTNPTVNIVVPDVYSVKAGDSLSKIAQQYQLSINFIMINNQLSSENIQVGQVLRLKENFITGERNEIGTVRTTRTIDVFSKNESGSIIALRKLDPGSYRVYSIDYENRLYNVGGNSWVRISNDTQFSRVGTATATATTFSAKHITHTVARGDNIWDLSVRYGIPQSELLKVNNLTSSSTLTIGQRLIVPQYQIPIKETVSARHGELLDWWTEAQYVVPIGKTFKVIDFHTGKSFMVKRTIGANHADSETLTVRDSQIASSIWNGYSWTPRPIIIEVDGRKLAASMSFMPHDVQYIKDNGITGHFDIHFKNSSRHKDGQVDLAHQRQINIAAGVVVR